MDIVYFGDGIWGTSCLQRLLDDGHNIRAIVLRKNPHENSFPQFASSLGVPVLSPKKVNDKAFVNQVRELEPHLNISVSYDQIFHRPILDSAKFGFINVHAGKLPSYRGRSVINWAIINNETELGLTVHYVDEGIDTGNILVQETVPIFWEDTYGSLQVKAENALPDIVSKAVGLAEIGDPGRAQIPDKGTYFGGRRPGDEWVDWSDTSQNIYNKIRAITDPGPGARTSLENRTLILWAASYCPDWPKYIATPGEVVGVRPGQSIFVKTGDSTIEINRVSFDECGATRVIPRFQIGTRFHSLLSAEIHQVKAVMSGLSSQLAQLGEQLKNQ